MPANIGSARAGLPVAHGAGGEENPFAGGFQERAGQSLAACTGRETVPGFMAAVPSLVTRCTGPGWVSTPRPPYTPESENPEKPAPPSRLRMQ